MEMFSGFPSFQGVWNGGCVESCWSSFFYCVCLVGCVLLFVKWLFGLCFIHVVCVWCVVVVDVFFFFGGWVYI